MTAGKTVTTHATGTHFGRYYGGGNGGTSYYREQGYDGNDYNAPADSAGWAVIGTANNQNEAKFKQFNPLNTRTGTNVPMAYDDAKGFHALYEFECFVESNGLGGKPTLRTYTHWAQFGSTSTGNITNELTDCIIEQNFYGGGNLGNVNGKVESTLTDCTVKGYACGGGFSGTIEPFRIHDKSQTQFPYIDKAGVMQNPNGKFEYVKNSDNSDRYYTWCYRKSNSEFFPAGVVIPSTANTNNPTFEYNGKWYVLTTVSLEGLGAVSGNATLTLKGNTTVGTLEGGILKAGTGNVYGGGDESSVDGNTTVILKGDAKVLAYDLEGTWGMNWNGTFVGGSSEVKIQDATTTP